MKEKDNESTKGQTGKQEAHKAEKSHKTGKLVNKTGIPCRSLSVKSGLNHKVAFSVLKVLFHQCGNELQQLPRYVIVLV